MIMMMTMMMKRMMMNQIILCMVLTMSIVRGYYHHHKILRHHNTMIMKVQGHSNYFSKLTIHQWGLFEKAELNLDGKPNFIAITGETGAGKSMLISALEYICGLYKKKILSRNNQESIITLDSNDIDRFYTKAYNPKTKKSITEIEGQKVLMKDMTNDLMNSVRFWNGDSLGMLERGNDGVISYIDSGLGAKGVDLFNQLKVIYDEWNDVNDKLDDAIKLDKRLKKKNEIELISHFSTEMSQFESKLSSILSELLEQVEAVIDSAKSLDEGESHNSKALSEKSLYDLIRILNGVGINDRKSKKDDDSSLNLSEAWKAILVGNKILSGLSVAIQTNAGSDLQSRKKTDQSRRPPDEIIGNARRDILQYQKQLLSLQRYMNEIGFDDTSINSKIDSTEDLFQETIIRMEKLQASLQNLDKSMPNFDSLVTKLSSVRSEWESLARKHDVVPADLQNLKKGWVKDLKSLKSIGTDLPLLKARFGELQRDYIKVASELTSLRKESASRLSEKINDLLPSLEMPNKVVSIVVAKLFDKDNINDESKYYDYDDEEYEGIKLKFIKPGTYSTEKGWDDVYIEINQDNSINDNDNDRVAHVLSSGELARLSLALETCSYLNFDAIDDENYYNNDIKLILFDEVDAHIGGEAAVSVAKLFKTQGQFRQVIAITHNPILAAAADKHYVVSKRNGITNYSSDYGNYISSILEVNGDEREAEIMRIASGKMESSAGREWVRDILKIDYSIK